MSHGLIHYSKGVGGKDRPLRGGLGTVEVARSTRFGFLKVLFLMILKVIVHSKRKYLGKVVNLEWLARRGR